MAIIVMVYGQSGTGKSTSLRNFKPEDVCIVNVSGKPLPFKNKHKTFNTDDYNAAITAIFGGANTEITQTQDISDWHHLYGSSNSSNLQRRCVNGEAVRTGGRRHHRKAE